MILKRCHQASRISPPLVTLCLNNCKKLKSVEEFPLSLQFLNSHGCDSLEAASVAHFKGRLYNEVNPRNGVGQLCTESSSHKKGPKHLPAQDHTCSHVSWHSYLSHASGCSHLFSPPCFRVNSQGSNQSVTKQLSQDLKCVPSSVSTIIQVSLASTTLSLPLPF